ncbi:MAG TPA: MFS transporter [Anaerolineae bacterium]|nr:MFS transporter [Anaerolineae bacterium]
MPKQWWFVLILGFIGFVTSFGAHIVAVNLPIYAEQISVGVAIIGILIAAYDFAEIVAKPIFGALADRRGMKQTLLAGIALFTLASLAYPVIDPRLLIVVRFVQGVGAAALSAVSLALVGVYFTEQRGRAYGIYNAIKGAGYVLSPIIGGLIVLKTNFATIFLAAAAIGAIAFLLALFLPSPVRKPNDVFDDDDLSLKSFIAVFRQRDIRPWYIVMVVNMFFVGILFSFLPVRVHNLHYDPLTTGLILTTATTSYLLIQPLAGVLADRFNAATTVRIGLLLSAIAIILVPFVQDVALIIVSIMAGAGIGTVWTNTDTLISTLAKSGQLGATMGAAGSFKELGDMLGPLLIGFLSQAFGLTIGFVVCGIFGLVSILLIKPIQPAQHMPSNQIQNLGRTL